MVNKVKANADVYLDRGLYIKRIVRRSRRSSPISYAYFLLIVNNIFNEMLNEKVHHIERKRGRVFIKTILNKEFKLVNVTDYT